MGAKRQVVSKVGNCLVELEDQSIKENLNVLPLGSYDVLIKMDWLEVH